MIDAPATSFFARAFNAPFAAALSAALLPEKLTVSDPGFAGSAMATDVVVQIERYVLSPALVAVTSQVPALVALRELPAIEQPLAEPSVTV